MKVFSSASQRTGKLGEDIACAYLKQKGFIIIERNFTRKWGEIDIVAKKQGITHFVEVKSISRETEGYRPEEQVHSLKLSRLIRIIETYISSHRVGGWKFDVITIVLDDTTRKAQVKMLEDLIL